jgi:hypothetical protein
LHSKRSPHRVGLVATLDGFSLHAQVRIRADARDDLEQLCHYIAWPAIATERLSLARAGKVVYALRTPWRSGTTHFVFEPLTFIERRAIDEYLLHFKHERNHQGIGNELVGGRANARAGPVEYKERIGGLLKFYSRAA